MTICQQKTRIMTIKQIVDKAVELGDAASVIPPDERDPGGCTWGKGFPKKSPHAPCWNDDAVFISCDRYCPIHAALILEGMRPSNKKVKQGLSKFE